jgi:uncharacterized membrane protein YfcA
LSFIAGGLSSISGIGGSGIIVPLLQIVGHFPVSVAVTISKAMVFGMSLSNSIILFQKKIPNTNVPMINYDLAMLFTPSILLGTILGVLFVIIIPDVVLLILLLILLTLTGIRTIVNAVNMFKAENNTNQEIQYEHMIEEDKKKFSIGKLFIKIGVIFITWIIILLTTMLKGGTGFKSLIGVKVCSTEYWILKFSNFPIIFLVMALTGLYLWNSSKNTVVEGYSKKFYEIYWDVKKVVLIPLLGFVSGVLSTALGNLFN